MTRNRAAKKPRPPAGTPTDTNLFTLHEELIRHGQGLCGRGPLWQFEASSMAGLRRLLAAGYLEPAGERGRWIVSEPGWAALTDWRARNPEIVSRVAANQAGGRRASGASRAADRQRRHRTILFAQGLGPTCGHTDCAVRFVETGDKACLRSNRAAGKRAAIYYAVQTSPPRPRAPHGVFWAPGWGEVTTKPSRAWKTTDEAAARRMADENGGTVVRLERVKR